MRLRPKTLWENVWIGLEARILFALVSLLIMVCVVRAAPVELETGGIFSVGAPAVAAYSISGTGQRNNAVRFKLKKPFIADELFVRFRVNYAANTIDQAEVDGGNGEFFVLWLDEEEGFDGSAHAGGVPNLGIHVKDGKNAFMIRYTSGQESFAPTELVGDREFVLIGRLWKTSPGPDSVYDALDLWVDPKLGEEFKPQASRMSRRSIETVQWIGFATGGKTEPDDRILISDIALADSWSGILGLPDMAPAPKQPEPEPPPVKTVAFRTDIHPILRDRCFDCHSGLKAKGGVRLDILDEALNQTAPRDASASRLIQLVTHTDPEKRMPPAKHAPLNPEQIGKLRAWIDEGLDWDHELLPTPIPVTDHWSFQPLARPDVPPVKQGSWVSTPVDNFILKRLEQQGLQPAPRGARKVLTRRLAFDLIGLPESVIPIRPDESLDDYSVRLLESVHHGERWGRHWLDVARWAESNGHQHNRDRPHAWRYRDYVIRSFAENKPFDQFVKEQLAGDEIPFDEDAIIATGFLAAARYSGNDLDEEIQRNDILVDQVNTTSTAFLGLTFECAQCHTHKFDPISIRDYYQLQSFFRKGQPGNVVLKSEDKTARKLIERRWAVFDGVHARMVETKRRQGNPDPILIIPKSVIGGMRSAEKKLFKELEAEIAKLPQSWSYYSPATAATPLAIAPHEMRWPLPRHPEVLARQKTHLLVRGDVKSRGPEVQPGLPQVFATGAKAGNRTELASWLTSTNNPLTARVWVNRIWQWHFGRGLVETSGDFGKQGTTPSHPELLDWLASELIGSNWDSGHVHRLILSSSTWRMSSEYSPGNARLDPDNRNYWRWQPRRLEAEAIRDTMLAVAGLLDLNQGGRSVPLAKADSSNRRSVYLQQKRDKLPHQQMLFDGAGAITSCAQRRVSTVSLQPLYLLNSKFASRVAADFAKSLESVSSKREQASAAIQRALGRDPDPEELARTVELLNDRGLVAVCAALMNLNEFVYIP
jgi:hypothetical protein